VDEPAHTVTFGRQVHSKGILGGSDEAGRHVGYLTKYLCKNVSEVIEQHTGTQRRHADRLHAELAVTPCSPRCAVWLLYGVQPLGVNSKTVPGHCNTAGPRSAYPGAGRWSPASGRARVTTRTARQASPCRWGSGGDVAGMLLEGHPKIDKGCPSDMEEHPADLAIRTLERMTGIEPAFSAWEADVLPLNYIRGASLRPAKRTRRRRWGWEGSG
jgi:hypothetical protein